MLARRRWICAERPATPIGRPDLERVGETRGSGANLTVNGAGRLCVSESWFSVEVREGLGHNVEEGASGEASLEGDGRGSGSGWGSGAGSRGSDMNVSQKNEWVLGRGCF
jgi:hypothetical protein